MELLEQFKNALEGKFYDRVKTEIEKLSKQTVDQQFSCNWDVVESAIERATGKDSDVMLTEDWFANQDPKKGGKTLEIAIHQINKHYFKYHSSTPRILKTTRLELNGLQ